MTDHDIRDGDQRDHDVAVHAQLVDEIRLNRATERLNDDRAHGVAVGRLLLAHDHRGGRGAF